MIRFDDGTFGIIDFKTSSVSKTSEIYARQLHAYAAAVENPSENSELVQGKVSDMGLVVFTPDQFHTPTDDKGQIRSALTGSLTYQHVPHNEEKFHAFLGEILDVLELPEAPQAPPPKWKKGNSFSSCSYCDFLHRASKTGWIPHAH